VEPLRGGRNVVVYEIAVHVVHPGVDATVSLREFWGGWWFLWSEVLTVLPSLWWRQALFGLTLESETGATVFYHVAFTGAIGAGDGAWSWQCWARVRG